jgi:hypothetical protein
MKRDLYRIKEVYSNIHENAPQQATTNQQVQNYTSQYQQNNPTKAITSQTSAPQASADSQQQINSLVQRIGNLEKQVADLIASQQKPTM